MLKPPGRAYRPAARLTPSEARQRLACSCAARAGAVTPPPARQSRSTWSGTVGADLRLRTAPPVVTVNHRGRSRRVARPVHGRRLRALPAAASADGVGAMNRGTPPPPEELRCAPVRLPEEPRRQQSKSRRSSSVVGRGMTTALPAIIPRHQSSRAPRPSQLEELHHRRTSPASTMIDSGLHLREDVCALPSPRSSSVSVPHQNLC